MTTITKTCEFCSQPMTTTEKRLADGRGRYCSVSCSKRAFWSLQPPAQKQRYRYIFLPNHPLANRNGTALEHRIALYDKIGKGPHRCHHCGTDVAWSNMARTRNGALVVDHLDGDTRNNAPENLVPSCHGCNAKRGRTDIVKDDEPYVLMKSSRGTYTRHRAVQRNCLHCGAVFNFLAADKRPNKGKYCSRICWALGPKTLSSAGG